jgi:hypothetical protein
MKTFITGLALAAATVTGAAAVSVPTAAAAQDRYWHGPAHGPEWHRWREGYYGRWHRYPARVCRVRYHRTVCFYR